MRHRYYNEIDTKSKTLMPKNKMIKSLRVLWARNERRLSRDDS